MDPPLVAGAAVAGRGILPIPAAMSPADVLPGRHTAANLVDRLSAKAAVTTQGHHTWNQALAGPAADRLGRDLQLLSCLSRGEVLPAVVVFHWRFYWIGRCRLNDRGRFSLTLDDSVGIDKARKTA